MNDTISGICAILIFEELEGYDCSTGLTITEDTSKRPADLTYEIGTTAVETDITGLFTSDSEYANCWQYEFEYVNPTALPSADSQAILFDSSTMKVTVYSTTNSIAGSYSVKIKAIRVSDDSELDSWPYTITLTDPC